MDNAHSTRWMWPRRLGLRCILVILAVLICYCSRWDYLRFLTAEFNLRLDALAGMHLERLAPTTVMWKGTVYRYDIACTFADVWCGAIPLVWSLRREVLSNLIHIAVLGVVLFFFNVIRLSVSDVLFAAGIPWQWAHGLIGGLSYFAVWIWIWEKRAWADDPQPLTSAAEPLSS